MAHDNHMLIAHWSDCHTQKLEESIKRIFSGESCPVILMAKTEPEAWELFQEHWRGISLIACGDNLYTDKESSDQCEVLSKERQKLLNRLFGTSDESAQSSIKEQIRTMDGDILALIRGDGDNERMIHFLRRIADFLDQEITRISRSEFNESFSEMAMRHWAQTWFSGKVLHKNAPCDALPPLLYWPMLDILDLKTDIVSRHVQYVKIDQNERPEDKLRLLLDIKP